MVFVLTKHLFRCAEAAFPDVPMLGDNDLREVDDLDRAMEGLPAPSVPAPSHGSCPVPDDSMDAIPLEDTTAIPAGDSTARGADPSTFDTVPFDFQGAGIPLGSIPSEPSVFGGPSPAKPVMDAREADQYMEERIRFLEYLRCI